MNRTFKGLLSAMMLLSYAAISADFLPRSYSADTSRWLVGWTQQVNQYDMDKIYGTFSVQLGGGKSFRNDNITACLFGSDVNCGGCPTIVVSGTRVADRGANDWLADYFGLPSTFKSTVNLSPSITHFIADFGFFLGLDEWVNGLFFRVDAPVVRAKWNLDFCETVVTTGTIGYPAGYFSASAVPVANLLSSFGSYMNGGVPNLGSGITFTQLGACRINNCDETKTGLSDLRLILGWNFLRNEDYHMGLGIEFAAPTGNKPDVTNIFSPVIGNGNHFELGAFYTSHYTFWTSEDEESSFGLYVDAQLTHLFKNKQQRCFDLCGKGNSKYMLAYKLTDSLQTNHLINDTDPAFASASGYEFNNAYTPVANLTTRNVNVSYSVQGDITALFNYTRGGFGWDIGYNFWARSCENIGCLTDCDNDCGPCGVTFINSIPANTWALKGDASVVGWALVGTTTLPINLSPSESAATIHKGTNKYNGPSGLLDTSSVTIAGTTYTGLTPTENPGIDNPFFGATTGGSDVKISTALIDNILSSNPVRFLSDCDIDLKSGASKARSNKVFTHLQYTWDRTDWNPYLGVGASVEIGSNQCDSCDTGCNTCFVTSCTTACPTVSSCNTSCNTNCNDCCENCSLSQWEVWVKGGVSFN